ncbi:survival factor 1 [Nadsonia fulvescens var. elongata DSM 6958]|uniref:Survival factor 1 n=1 Tax=Nadsonia fulvescens var. elongata DSM 6958 TaxID=857566 RepID=A0A1E3PSC9_9ASCO|nr:survival factor 1 [Nadsonia fulvescens var. elongata DSM 6958]
MFKFLQGGLSAVVGTAEPIYGPEAFRSVSETVKGKNPFSDITANDLSWKPSSSTSVETQTFYFTCPETGHFGFAQLIFSTIMNVHTTATFTFKIVHKDKPEETLWTSTNLDDFAAEGTNFTAKGLSIKLNEDLTEYKFMSQVNPQSVIDLTFTRTCPGFKIGADGNSLYGEDKNHPWGSMRHAFWPGAKMSGKIIVKGHLLEIVDARSMYIMAMQGMKPHHAAARWNFLNYQGTEHSAILMEFTTPPSYGETTVCVAAVTSKDKLIFTSVDNKVEHLKTELDDVNWPAPKKIRFSLCGPKIDAVVDGDIKPEDKVEAVIEGDLNWLVERVDVMSEIPAFAKRIASSVSGTKPYIYQYCNPMKLSLTIDGKTITEEGQAYSEATFIC